MWRYYGQQRPPFAETPGEGQESVWDYPRPPRIASDRRQVIVRAGGQEIARSTRAVRVCETASPPTFYLPPEDVDARFLRPVAGSSWCEWKGSASYFDIVTEDDVLPKAAWSYAAPKAAFAAIGGCYSFYPARLQCTVAGEAVRPQPGGFYGGWVTDELVGPFKGGSAASAGW